MNYCNQCRCLTETRTCPRCGKTALEPVRAEDYCFLTEKEEMWAKMLEDILTDSGIPHTSLSVVGAALTLRGGARERIRIYVPYASLGDAQQLLTAAFPEDDDL